MIDQQEEEDYLYTSLVLVTGNLGEGFAFYGPFNDYSEFPRLEVEGHNSRTVERMTSPLYPAFEASMLPKEPTGPPACLVMAGNPADGYEFFGPFYGFPEAVAWAEVNLIDNCSDFHVAALEASR